MKDDEIKDEIVQAAEAVEVVPVVESGVGTTEEAVEKTAGKVVGRPERGRRPRGKGGRGGRRGGFERVKPEFDQKILDIRRVTRVVAGGRRFSFSVALAIGDRKGAAGVGTGKAADTSLAIEKAFRAAKKNLLRLKLTKSMSIPHAIEAKYGPAEIIIMPNKGKGLVVGSSARILLNLAGVRDVTAKVLSGSKNKLSIANATMKALGRMMLPREKTVVTEKKEGGEF